MVDIINNYFDKTYIAFKTKKYYPNFYWDLFLTLGYF